MKKFFRISQVRTLLITLIVTLIAVVVLGDLNMVPLHEDIQLLFVIMVMILIMIIYTTSEDRD